MNCSTRGGLERRSVTPDEIRALEPALHGRYYGGFYTPSDTTGDIHKFTTGPRQGLRAPGRPDRLRRRCRNGSRHGRAASRSPGRIRLPTTARCAWASAVLEADALVICAGVGSRELAASLGDRVNIYPVKGYSITVALDDAGEPGGGPDRQPARRRDQDRIEPARGEPFPCRRHGRVQRLQLRHPGRPHSPPGRLDPPACSRVSTRPDACRGRVCARCCPTCCPGSAPVAARASTTTPGTAISAGRYRRARPRSWRPRSRETFPVELRAAA